MSKGPILLLILDGWGHNEENINNPLSIAHTPALDTIFKNYPHAKLNASGEDVGLPKGQMGNSEVGHMSIGSGRLMMQDLPKISSSIHTGEINQSSELIAFLKKIKLSNNRCHIMGLLSDGGVHSHIDHFIWASNFFAKNECEVYLHPFLDGRDSDVTSNGRYLKQLTDSVKKYSNIKLATISGRYYAMDRDQRWERTTQAFEAIFQGKGQRFSDYEKCLEYYKSIGITDEFVMPSIMNSFDQIEDNDGIMIINFRADRVRQILEMALTDKFPNNQLKVFALGMTEYSQLLSSKMQTLFGSKEENNTLGEILAHQNLKQLRIAETEKYAHVTYFFNCGREKAFEGEDRILIDSPKVAKYDSTPEMAAMKITDVLIKKLENYDFVLLNYANMDMIGHTGNFDAAVKAIEVIDKCIERIVEKINELEGMLIITSDHGNIEIMKKPDGNFHTHHTTNLVPIILISDKLKKAKIRNGSLIDIAPTILYLMEINKPIEMTGENLIDLEKI